MIQDQNPTEFMQYATLNLWQYNSCDFNPKEVCDYRKIEFKYKIILKSHHSNKVFFTFNEY